MEQNKLSWGVHELPTLEAHKQRIPLEWWRAWETEGSECSMGTR